MIAGGGFAGISALRRLKKHKRVLKRGFKLMLLDSKPYSEFLPMLPDVVGGWMRPELLRYDLASLAEKQGAEFIRTGITSLDSANRIIKTGAGDIPYEYAVLATGSMTNFYGSADLQNSCMKLDNIDDAELINRSILEKAGKAGELNIIVVGGGYTGIEIATNINYLLMDRNVEYRVCVIERADDILLMLPGWIRKGVKRELDRLRIHVMTSDALREYDGSKATLSSGKEFNNALCVWSAGVKTPEYIDGSEFNKQKGRIRVDEQLRPLDPPREGVFIAGDTADFSHGLYKKPLRMAVMFSMGQGKTAAENVVKSILKKPLVKYRPLDLGYLVPVASGKALGKVMGMSVKGFPGYFMHYFMCAYRSEWGNRTGIMSEFIKKYFSR